MWLSRENNGDEFTAPVLRYRDRGHPLFDPIAEGFSIEGFGKQPRTRMLGPPELFQPPTFLLQNPVDDYSSIRARKSNSYRYRGVRRMRYN